MTTEKEKYFAQELLFSFFLLCAVILLLGNVLGGFKYFIIPALACGFSFSCFNKRLPERTVKIAVDIASVAAFLWLALSVFNSSLYYSEVIRACVKGAFIFVAAFSFGAGFGRSLHYIQAASVPLFMSFPVLVTEHGPFNLVLILSYIISWAVILRVKFYAAFKNAEPTQKIYGSKNYSHAPLFIIFVAVIAISWLLFSRIPLGAWQKAGVFPVKDVEKEMEEESLEKEYYKLQEELQKKVIRLIPDFPGADERFEALGLLDSLLKEWPYYTLQVEHAEEGLKSRMKNLGGGIEEGRDKQITLVMESYARKKTAMALKGLGEEMSGQLKTNPFNLFDRLSTLVQMQGLRRANTYQKIQAAGNSLRDTVVYASFSKEVKNRMRALSNDFQEWQSFAVYQQKMAKVEGGLEEFNPAAAKNISGILQGIRQLENSSGYQLLESQIAWLKGSSIPELQEAGKDLDEAISLKLELLLAEKQRQVEKKIEEAGLPNYLVAEFKETMTTLRTMEEREKFLEESQRLQEKAREYNVDISAQMQDLAQAKADAEVKEQQAETNAAPPPEPERITPPPEEQAARAEPQGASFWKALLALFLQAVPFLLAGIAAAFIWLYYRTRKRQKEMLGFFSREPREFIVRLYQNLRRVCGIFGLRHNPFTTVFYYAARAQEKFSIENNLFLHFSAKYQEARFSRHAFRVEDSSAALEAYNICLKKMFKQANKWGLFFRYLATLAQQSPLSLRGPSGK